MSIFSRHSNKNPMSIEELREAAATQFQKGDYKDAYETLHELLKRPDNTGWEAGKDYLDALKALERQDETTKIDDLRAEVLALRPFDWEFAAHCAMKFDYSSYGKVVEGRFIREYSGIVIDVTEQDRLFWMKAMLERPVPSEGEHLKDYYLALIQLFLKSRRFPRDFWRFQILTDLTEEPDYTQECYIPSASSTGIPVDENGEPLFFALPEKWEAAKNDGERLRWLFKRLSEAGGRAEALKLQANLFQNCYGMHEALESVYIKDIDLKKQLRTLSDEETWTKLATGYRRFFLPPEFNPIHLCKELASMGEKEKVWAYDHLIKIYEERFQYEMAESLAEYLAGQGPFLVP
ncbi:MAG: hypothetical protein IJS08_03930, partial [Victivallales bacterium]|nr:hypothetical protein [Victivallales bacterium]